MNRSIEILIGRLVVDDDFRRFFISDPAAALVLVDEWGLTLTDAERLVLEHADPAVWDRVAEEYAMSLQRAQLANA